MLSGSLPGPSLLGVTAVFFQDLPTLGTILSPQASTITTL